MNKTRKLAASFVVSVAAACGGAQEPVTYTHNPPMPPPPYPPQPYPQPPGAGFATPPQPGPPPPAAGARINRRRDGTCWRSEPVDCPPAPVTCNPPPPVQVACP